MRRANGEAAAFSELVAVSFRAGGGDASDGRAIPPH
jgi:hypothetical protein